MEPIVSVIGGRKVNVETYGIAERVGYQLASYGVTVCTGGLTGVMEAVSWGAKQAGGRTIGILPGCDRQQANRYIDYPIVSGLGIARNLLVVRTGLVVIAIAGLYGTLSEIAYALHEGKLVIALDSWRLEREIPNEPRFVLAGGADEAVSKAVTELMRLGVEFGKG